MLCLLFSDTYLLNLVATLICSRVQILFYKSGSSCSVPLLLFSCVAVRRVLLFFFVFLGKGEVVMWKGMQQKYVAARSALPVSFLEQLFSQSVRGAKFTLWHFLLG